LELELEFDDEDEDEEETLRILLCCRGINDGLFEETIVVEKANDFTTININNCCIIIRSFIFPVDVTEAQRQCFCSAMMRAILDVLIIVCVVEVLTLFVLIAIVLIVFVVLIDFDFVFCILHRTQRKWDWDGSRILSLRLPFLARSTANEK
jgi:hypothetical protein